MLVATLRSGVQGAVDKPVSQMHCSLYSFLLAATVPTHRLLAAR